MIILQSLNIILAGIFTSWTDFRQGKIKNRHLAIFACIGLILNILSFADSGMVQSFFLDISLTIFFAVLLWWRGFIPAGDSKLLMAYAIAIPAWWYPDFAPNVFPFSLIMAIAFIGLAIPVIIAAIKPSSIPKDLATAYRAIRSRSIVDSILLPTWLFLVGWRLWIVYAQPNLQFIVGVLAAFALIIFSFMFQKWFLSWGLKPWLKTILTCFLAGIFVYLEGRPILLLAASIAAGLVFFVSEFFSAHLGQIDQSVELVHRFAPALFIAAVLTLALMIAQSRSWLPIDQIAALVLSLRSAIGFG